MQNQPQRTPEENPQKQRPSQNNQVRPGEKWSQKIATLRLEPKELPSQTPKQITLDIGVFFGDRLRRRQLLKVTVSTQRWCRSLRHQQVQMFWP